MDKIDQILNDIAHLTGRVDEMLPRIVKTQERHDERIGKLESAESYRKGQSAVISFATALLVSIGGWFIKK